MEWAVGCVQAFPSAQRLSKSSQSTVGTIPFIAATMPALAPVFGLGGDRDPEAVSCLAKNYRVLVEERGQRSAAGAVQWDARRLPVRDQCVDIVICDLPFGKRHKVRGGLRNLYKQAFRECARVVRCVRVCVVCMHAMIYLCLQPVGRQTRGWAMFNQNTHNSVHTGPAAGSCYWWPVPRRWRRRWRTGLTSAAGARGEEGRAKATNWARAHGRRGR